MATSEQKNEAQEFCAKLGKHIRALREENGISVEEIAFKASIDAQNLRKYELGKQEMRVGMLKRIATAFEISTSELLKFDEA